MDVWIMILGLILFLGFSTAVAVCIGAIKQQKNMVVNSRLHRKLSVSEVIFANVGLVVFAILIHFQYYIFVPSVLAFVLLIVLTTKVKSGLTNEGALVGTTFIYWEFMKGFKFINDPEDSNIIILKIRANRKQYVMICDRRDRFVISDMMKANSVNPIETNR